MVKKSVSLIRHSVWWTCLPLQAVSRGPPSADLYFGYLNLPLDSLDCARDKFARACSELVESDGERFGPERLDRDRRGLTAEGLVEPFRILSASGGAIRYSVWRTCLPLQAVSRGPPSADSYLEFRKTLIVLLINQKDY